MVELEMRTGNDIEGQFSNIKRNLNSLSYTTPSFFQLMEDSLLVSASWLIAIRIGEVLSHV